VRIAKKKINMLLSYLFMIFLIFIYIYSIRIYSFNKWIELFFLIVVIQMVFQIAIMIYMKVHFLSLSFIFLILTYFFHFGQLFILVLFPEFENPIFNYILYYDHITVKNALSFSLFVILFTGLGMLLSMSDYSNSLKESGGKKLFTLTSYQLRKIAWVIIFVTFPIQVFLDFTKIIISFREGYIATYFIGIPGFIGAIASISFSGFILLLLSYKNKPKIALKILIFIILYLIITMLIGNRGFQLIRIIMFLYVYNTAIAKINVKKLILYSFLFYFLTVFLVSIATVRAFTDNRAAIFLETFLDNIMGNPLKILFSELGGTINTVCLTLQQVPQTRDHAYGLTYLASIFTIFPDVGDVFSDINQFSEFQKNLVGSALGGSYIAELYYNFSIWGIVIATGFGIFINKISEKLHFYLTNELYLHFIYLTPLYFQILWWARDNFSSLLRPFIWNLLFVYLVKEFLNIKISSQ